MPFTQSSRLDHWSQNFDVATAAQVVDLLVVHEHHPQGRFITDINIGVTTGKEAAKMVCDAIPSLPICKWLGIS